MNYKISKISNYLSLIISFLFFSEVLAQADSTHQLTLMGIDYASTMQYEEAIEVFDEIISLEPNNPKGYFLKSAAYFWVFSTDMHNEAIGDTLKEWSFKAVEVAETRLDENENDIDARFFIGGAYGTLGRYYGMRKSFLKAYWYGQKGKNYLEEVIESDSTYYDAYLGLGIYHYLADVLPKFVKVLSFLLGVDGDRDKGIYELNLAAEKGVYTKTEAMFFLSAIYTYREKEYEKAVEILNKLLGKYPNNGGALIHLGRCYSYMGRCALALQTFQKILDQDEENIRLPITSLHYQIGDVQYKLNDFVSAIKSYTISVESDTSASGNRRWTYPWALYKLGRCYEIIGDRERAEFYYNLVDEDDNERAYKYTQDRLNEPLKEIDITIIRNKNLSDCRNHQIALETFNEIQKDIEAKSNKDLEKELLEVKFEIGKINYELKKYSAAITYLREVVDDEAKEDDRLLAWAHYYLGNCYRETGEIEKALEEYDNASETEDMGLLNRINKAVQNIEVNSDQ